MGLSLTGLAGLFVSENLVRSIYFLVWTSGTILVLPIVLAYLTRRLGLWIFYSALAYFFLQCGLVIFDSVACQLSRGEFSIGRTIRHFHLDYKMGVCRAFAGYQEPTYFGAYGLFALIWIRTLHRRFAESLPLGWVMISTFVAVLAVVLSTSRMAWIGLTVWAFLELMVALISLRKGSLSFKLSRNWKLGLALGAILVAYPLAEWMGAAYHYKGQQVFRPASNEGIVDRIENVEISGLIWKESPLIGVGPGGAGAMLLSRHSAHPWYQRKIPERKAIQANDPVSYTLWGELLSEWGLLGTVFFLVILLGLFSGLSGKSLIVAMGVFGVVSFTWQTLPRFDLWLVLSLFSMSQKRELKI